MNETTEQAWRGADGAASDGGFGAPEPLRDSAYPPSEASPRSGCPSRGARTNAAPSPRATEAAAREELVLPRLKSQTAGGRINELHTMGRKFGRLSLCCTIWAGWELEKARQLVGHGGWSRWVARHTVLSLDTARRYMGVYAATVGAAREEAGEPLTNALTAAELTAATTGMESKTVTDLYERFGLVRRNPGWGGARAGAGRPANGEAPGARELDAALDAVEQSEALNWAAASGHLEGLARLNEARDVFARLSDAHLAMAATTLDALAARAREVLASRMGREGGA